MIERRERRRRWSGNEVKELGGGWRLDRE